MKTNREKAVEALKEANLNTVKDTLKKFEAFVLASYHQGDAVGTSTPSEFITVCAETFHEYDEDADVAETTADLFEAEDSAEKSKEMDDVINRTDLSDDDDEKIGRLCRGGFLSETLLRRFVLDSLKRLRTRLGDEFSFDLRRKKTYPTVGENAAAVADWHAETVAWEAAAAVWAAAEARKLTAIMQARSVEEEEEAEFDQDTVRNAAEKAWWAAYAAANAETVKRLTQMAWKE